MSDLTHMQQLVNHLLDHRQDAEDLVSQLATLVDAKGRPMEDQLRLALVTAVLATQASTGAALGTTLRAYPQAAQDVASYFTAKHLFHTGTTNTVH